MIIIIFKKNFLLKSRLLNIIIMLSIYFDKLLFKQLVMDKLKLKLNSLLNLFIVSVLDLQYTSLRIKDFFLNR